MKRVRSRRSKYRRFLLAIVILLTTGVTAAFARGAWSAPDQAEDAIATVNGVPISIAEFNRAIRLNKSQVIHYFQNTYHAEQTKQFWTTAFHGEIPAEMLKKKALEESVRIKVRQLLAKERGALQEVSYQGFLQQLQQENQRRAQAISNNQVVYGPAQYDEDSYFEYVISNVTLAAKRQMLQTVLQQNESLPKQFYEQHKAERYLTPGLVKIQRISRSFLDSNHHTDPSLQQEIKQQLEEAAAKLQFGGDFEEIAAVYNPQDTALELTIHLGDERRNARSPIAQAAVKLPVDAISQIIEENGSYHLLKCIERVEPNAEYLPYEQVKEQVLQDLIQQEYESMIYERMTTADIQVNDKQMQSVQIQ
ncbi:peptidylprolyl isomerase [Paenibacillus guangzhouensis]|uniref:peptidylprolyl isomerase n=1 Tax=Paenibacillus guangzhouensis TaxID=1473112 RepID=UPI0012678127|nr:peptidyl-prolyl cis-trans isomerase [Paenibacillus guangzhouensis]